MALAHPPRRRRLDLELTQLAVAKRFGVNAWTVVNWEQDRTLRRASNVGALYDFLGYSPEAVPADLAGRIRAARRLLSLSQEGLALRLGVDPSTVQKWKRGPKRPFARFTRLLEDLAGFHGCWQAASTNRRPG